MKGTERILLDMDGVLSDFLSGALIELNREFSKDITLEKYVTEFGQWETYDYYGITKEQFWSTIEKNPNFWINLAPTPYGIELYKELQDLGTVTIVTSPSLDPRCIVQKYQWLKRYLGITTEEVFMGSRKYLFADERNTLIDDYYNNVISFREAGGNAILVPSVWNQNDLTLEIILDIIYKHLYGRR